MLSKFKEAVLQFSNNKKDTPFIVAIASGLYPFLSYFSNNYSSVNSLYHILSFILVFIGIPVLVIPLVYYVVSKSKKFSKYKTHVLFALFVVSTSLLISQAVYLDYKRYLWPILILSVILSFWFHGHYKKLVILLFFISLMPFFKLVMKSYFHVTPMSWAKLPDDIEKVELKHKPNIYIIQPDGYASERIMNSEPYNFNSNLYKWLSGNGFKSYTNFRSNYPLTLSSNSTLFTMRQHYFGDIIFPSLEVPNAREIITGNNPVISIFKNNGYKSYFIVELEYFQQNRKENGYDYYNISKSEIPLFTNGKQIKKDVFEDFKLAMKLHQDAPKFFFVQKLMPHHVPFTKGPDRVNKERDWYLNRIKEANLWVKETVSFISKKDTNAIIAVLADHGGWVGLESFHDMATTYNEAKMYSIYSPIAAIKWNGFLTSDYDNELKSSVNLFRVLFSALSEDKSYLDYLESNSSYNLRKKNFFKVPSEVINNEGEVLQENL